MTVTIREQRAADGGAVEATQAAGFGDDATIVVGLLRGIQALPDSACALSLVAELEGDVVGHAQFSRSLLDAPSRLVDVGVLSPIAVLPDFQRQGVGRALIEEGARILGERGVPLIFLEGSPIYYSRRGFVAAEPLEFRRPSLRIPEPAFQVMLLPAYESWMTGTLVYDQVFWEHDAVGLRPDSTPAPDIP